MKNLGAGGALFNYDRKIDVDSLVNFKINFPAAQEPIDCIGRVIRVEKPSYSFVFNVAAVFTSISDKERNIINTAAEEFYAKKPGMID